MGCETCTRERNHSEARKPRNQTPLPQDAASEEPIRNLQESRKPVTPPVAADCSEVEVDSLTEALAPAMPSDLMS